VPTSTANPDSELFDRIGQLLPHASESVLQEVWTILSNAVKDRESASDSATNSIAHHRAFLNGYEPEDKGLYDEY
jgi:hypothetical protein